MEFLRGLKLATEAPTLRETLVFRTTNNSLAIHVCCCTQCRKQQWRTEGQEAQMASDDRGGGVQYVIDSFELQPESQMMLL